MKRSKSFFIAKIVCLVAVLFIISVEPFTTFVHEESTSYPSLPRVWRNAVYDDGTTVFHIIRRDTSIKLHDKVCLIQKLMLRILYPNGTLTELDMELNIPSFNFCIFSAKSRNFDPIKMHALKPGYLLLQYYNATDASRFETWEEWGMVIDWQGQTYEPTFLGLSFIDAITRAVVPGENKELIKLSGGVITLPIFNGVKVSTIATVDEGYAIVFANSSDIVDNADPLLPRGGLFVLSLAYGQNTIYSPSLLYQFSLPNLLFDALQCGITYVSVGHMCTFTVQQNLGDPTNLTKSDLYYFKITFLSSGSVTSFISMSRILPNIVNVDVNSWQIRYLPYGGYFLNSNIVRSNTQQKVHLMVAYVFDENDTNGTPMELNEFSSINIAGITGILPNNTLYIAQQEVKDTWSLIFIDLPRFNGNKDHGYSNVHIDITDPPIRSTISSSLKQISITYFDAVDLSDGRASIYQINYDGQEVLKQFVSETSEVKIAGSISGVLRLTVEGTTYIDQLDTEGQTQFFNNLVNEISTMLKIPPSRLKSNGRFQVDFTISPEKQYLISLNIIQTKDKAETSVESIIKDLNTMILNKEVSPISLGRTTQFLDANYGLPTT
ncbi:16657_t:CDS:2, partial [Funneliformis caledonium]